MLEKYNIREISYNEDIIIFICCFIKGAGNFIKKCEPITFNWRSSVSKHYKLFLLEIVSSIEMVSEILVSKSFILLTIRPPLT